jgi:hypothetical protein
VYLFRAGFYPGFANLTASAGISIFSAGSGGGKTYFRTMIEN